MAGQHVLGHLWDYVERHVEIIDGVPYSKPHCSHWQRLGNHSRDRFYVHPETGLLCASEKTSRRQKPSQDRSDIVILDDDRQYCKLNDIWYLVTFENFPTDPAAIVTDVLLGVVSRSNAGWIGNRRVYAARKRQCNKKEIRFIMNQLAKR